MDIQFDLSKAMASFRDFSAEAHVEIEKAILESALKVERDAKLKFRGRDDESIPGMPPRNDTGTLRTSITHILRSSDSGIEAEVGTNIEYAKKVEFGEAGKTYPHPYLLPALEENRDFINKRVKDAIEEAMNA